MFIDQAELETKLEHSQNLKNILSPILGKDKSEDISRTISRDIVKEHLSDKDIENLLEQGIQINHNGHTRHIGHAGKVSGDSNLPQVIRNVIGIQANYDKPKNVAQQWGISTVQARNLAEGKPNRDRGMDDPSNAATTEAVNSMIDRVNDKVLKKIDMALEHITEGKLEGREAKELSTIASNLSRVMSVTHKTDKGNGGNNLQVVFMNPSPADMPSFKTIEVGA